jgi:hypothetical protein
VINIDEDEDDDDDDFDARTPNNKAEVDAGIGAKGRNLMSRGSQKKGSKIQPFSGNNGEEDMNSRGSLVKSMATGMKADPNNKVMMAMMQNFQAMMAKNKGKDPK